MTLINDGLPAYHDVYKKEFWTLRNPRTKHVRHNKLKGDMNNNKMERLNGEIRDREKVMRGLKKTDTPILKGYQILHNFIRQHQGLKGKTPAEACGIKVRGKQQMANANSKCKSKKTNQKFTVNLPNVTLLLVRRFFFQSFSFLSILL